MALHDIDFVLMWVDGADEQWRRKRDAYRGAGEQGDAQNIRYRDWGLLPYWFRGVEKFAPWVRRIYLVTDGQCPAWLRRDHPKLRVVDHTQFIPQQYLPTFSANPIELNLHRLVDLAEQFVFFNDDMFLIRDVQPQTFFKNGLPADDAVLSPIIVTRLEDIGSIVTNDMCVINHHFDKRQTVRQAPGKWITPKYGTSLLRTLLLMPWRHFPGFFNDHLPQPFLKQSFEEVWAAQPQILHETCTHRFRDYKRDVNQWLIRYWQLAGNRFEAAPLSRGRDLNVLDPDTFEHITRQRTQMVCINDSEKIEDFEALRERMEAAFRAILPERSSFETEI